ncbi:phosphoribosylglycinamide formyltransferase [Caballeronia sp. BR00000012568055]|uniref:phosphoribosylglycinamide formyltransferase n=1 Tax=Caballeronia sp. BR00000012568055 TaxID=2918761 RepID=UPI0023FA1982|nr:phosphoribosylglycinamide formyltransferase [Caballeronia sp. BR00000012568055]
MKKIVILISGRGSNMEAVVRACARDGWPARVCAVISNRPDAAGLAFAQANGIDTAVVDHREFDSRESFDAALAREIDRFEPDLVVLAGFMRVLTDGFVEHYAGRMLNIHPSLLPLFPGLRTHQQALDAGVRVHGATVHFVTPTLDHGPIVAQGAVPVIAGDDAAALAARLLHIEHMIYPRAVRWFIEGRLTVEGERVALTPSEPQWLFADFAGEGA